MIPRNFESLRELYELVRVGAMSLEIRYSEADDNWLFDIDSAAPSERFHIKRTADFDEGVRRCVEHIKDLGYKSGGGA